MKKIHLNNITYKEFFSPITGISTNPNEKKWHQIVSHENDVKYFVKMSILIRSVPEACV